MLLRALVYRYGCGAPVSGLEHALAEQERSSDLWDQLVKLDRTIEGQILQAAGLDDPAIMRAGEGIADLTGRLAEDPDDKLAREERRKLYAERRALLKVWNKAHKEVLREYEVRRQAGTKILRQQSEAWWPNQNRVLQAYEAARQLCRKTGRRLRLYDIDRDDGVLAYQIQRSPSTQVQRVPDPEGPKGFRIVSSDLGCSPEELQDGTVRAIQIGRVDPRAYDPATCRGERDRLHRTTVEMRVDAQGHTVRLPVWMHRPLPPGSRVKAAQITWYRRAARLHWQLCLVLNVPTIPLRAASATAPAQVELMWAREGGLNVLSVTPPEGAAPSIWALPPRWLGRADLIARRSSESEAQLRTLREAVAGDVDLEDICATDSVPQIMDLLQLRWTRLRPAVRHAYQVLRREWKAHEGLRGKVIRDRRDYYRRIAREIVSRWDVIALPELDLSALATAHRGDALNADRYLAAPHTLRAEIIHQAAKAGCHVIASGPGITPREKRESTRWARLKSLAKQVSQRRAQSHDHAGV